MPRLAAVFTALALVAGCNVATRSGRNNTIATGLIIAAVGVGLTVAAVADEPEPRSDIGCAFGGCAVDGIVYEAKILGAGALAASGLLMALVGVASNPPDETPAPIAFVPGAPAPRGPGPDVDVQALALSAARIGSTSSTPARERPLPEIATDATTLQLAKQARGAAMRGDCALADRLLGQIASRDGTYSSALVANGVVAPCR